MMQKINHHPIDNAKIDNEHFSDDHPIDNAKIDNEHFSDVVKLR